MKVSDISLSELIESSHDLVVWGNGYEERATHFPGYMEDKVEGECLVLGFKNDDAPNKENTEYFESRWSKNIIPVSSKDSAGIVEVIESYSLGENARILVDYSSMPRDWYAALIDTVSVGFQCSTLVSVLWLTDLFDEPSLLAFKLP